MAYCLWPTQHGSGAVQATRFFESINAALVGELMEIVRLTDARPAEEQVFTLRTDNKMGPRRVLQYGASKDEAVKLTAKHISSKRLAVPGFRQGKAPVMLAYRTHRGSCDAALIRLFRTRESTLIDSDLDKAFSIPEYSALPWDGHTDFLIEVSFFERPSSPNPHGRVGGAARAGSDPEMKLPIPGSLADVQGLMPSNLVATMYRGGTGLGMALPNANTALGANPQLLPSQLSDSGRLSRYKPDGVPLSGSSMATEKGPATPTPSDHVEQASTASTETRNGKNSKRDEGLAAQSKTLIDAPVKTNH